MIKMRYPSWLLEANPRQAVLEMLVLSVLLWGGMFLMVMAGASFMRREEAAMIVDILCMLYYVSRLRIPDRFWSWQTGLDILIALGVILLQCTFAALQFSFELFPQMLLTAPKVIKVASGRDVAVVVAVVLFLSNCTGYLLFRLGVRALRFWNQLRRKHLLWALTHSHVLLVVSVAGFLILLADLALIAFTARGSYEILMVLPLTLLLTIPSIIALIIIVPPFALFSYFVIRRTTDRLRALMGATSALRGGNYSVRVPVVGEDEVAQLQTDFNVMAADLERTMSALQQERDRVAALLQERRQLIANVSHELRTPVATLRGYLETTLIHWKDIPPPHLHQDLRIMEDEVVHLQMRVEELFTLARADVGRPIMKIEPTAVGQLVQRVVDARAPLVWQTSRIELVAAVPSGLPQALVDPQRLEQALQNLLHNGVRHTAPGGIVAIMVRPEGHEIVLQVRDTGEGIEPKDLLHIWERFYQTESARTRMGGGTGLGLALVKEWIEGMGGSVAVESVPGEGSCFTLRLQQAGPYAPATSAPEKDSVTSPQRANVYHLNAS